MNDLQKAMQSADDILQEAYNKPANEDLPDTTQDPGEMFEQVIEDAVAKFKKLNDADNILAQDAHNTLEAVEQRRERRLRYLKALHAARTELTRPE